jgi:two-component system, OmpR family, sensor histidine kinase KdpD
MSQMQFNKKPIFSFLLRHLSAFAAICFVTIALRPFKPFLETQLIALIYLLPVIVSTVLWGLSAGILAGFLAFLAYNYFYIPPYYTFAVHKTQDLITLIIFLIVAVVVSQLIGQAREGKHLAESREWEATRMYELISSLAGLQDIQGIAITLANQILETFQCDRVEVHIDGRKAETSLIVIVPQNMPTEQPEQRPASRIPLMTARGIEGEVRLWQQRPILPPGEKRLLEAYSSQGALAIERIRLMKGENKAKILEESDRLKSSLLNSVSHELRTPLSAIKASVSSLRSETVDLDAMAQQDLLTTIEEETDHLNLLVGNLLDMSRIESGALKPQLRWNAIGEIAMGIITKMRAQLQGHRLVTNFSESLPLVPTDYVMIGQVFTNLLSNSAKYAPNETTITLSAEKEGDMLHVQVANQGPPVPENFLERIFDKFNRVTFADRVTGTGLGLSICKGIIEAHGGRIWAENQPCCFIFHFTLPLTLNGELPDIPKEEVNG